MRISVYTCIVGDYDLLLPPRVAPKGVRFVCFTDQPRRGAQGWEMLPLSHPSSVVRPDLVNRFHKFFPHCILPMTDWSVYVDGNMRLIGDITHLVERVAEQHVAIACPRHPERATVFEEAAACEALGKFDQRDREVIREQLAFYDVERLPTNVRLTANYLIIRRHMSAGLDDAMNLWWYQLLRFTRRDQISLPYVLWKTGLPAMLFDENASVPNPYFIRYGHRMRGLRGLWQRIYLRRDDTWWRDALNQSRRWLLP